MGGNWSGGFGGNWFGGNWFGGNWSGSGGAALPVFAMRADRPLAEIPVPSQFGATFRDRDWDADLLALAIVPQFLAAQVSGQTWDVAIVLPAPATVTQAVIDDLLELAVTERPEALGEIVQQHQNFQLCWLHLLNIDGGSHPATFLLMKLAARVGELAMIVLKRRNRTRARPSQICPTLYPPVPVPGHSSYPAGHALVAALTSACLAELVSPHATALEKLADRVGFNRVIAGLHFRQDVTVGADVGRKLHPFIKQCPLYQTTFTAAQAEWV
jgi:membrane-associated phospholipid phosphatase